jgi:hypothetical protein
MEDLHEQKQSWGWDDYRLAARRVGRFNGAYLAGLPLPEHPWLSDQWHCAIVPPLADVLDHLDDYLAHPLAQRVLPLTEKHAILDVWRERDRFCAALASLPQTLCHLDVFPRNLFHSAAETKLIDWALVGRAGVGEELVCFVSLALYAPHLSLAQADRLDRTLFDGYVDGLRDAGWTGEAGLARLGYTCAMALRGLAGVKQDLLLMCDEAWRARPRRGGRFETLEDQADFWADLRRFRLLQLADEARGLLPPP